MIPRVERAICSVIIFLFAITKIRALLPFKLDSDCFIHIGDTKPHLGAWEYTLMRLYSQINLIWTFNTYDFDTASLSVQSDNITISQGYFRFNMKLRSSCVLFLIQPHSLSDTVRVIDQSGFGNKDAVPFFIFTQSRSIINAFSKALTTSPLLQWSPTFHAPVLFIDGHSPFVLFHCYFCPMKVLKSPPTLAMILERHRKFNEQGHSLSFLPIQATPQVQKCLNDFAETRFTLSSVLWANKICTNYGALLGPIQNKMNFTFIKSTSVNLVKDVIKMRWFLKIRPEDSFLPDVAKLHFAKQLLNANPLAKLAIDLFLNPAESHFAHDRGHIFEYGFPHGNYVDEIVLCSNINKETGFSYHILRLIKLDVWLVLLLVELVVLAFYKN